MGILGRGNAMGSPVQKHEVQIANDLFWVSGVLETLGNPHHYINQDGLDFLHINEAHVVPWSFSGLPASRPEMINMASERIQFLLFAQEASLTEFRAAPNTMPIILHLPLAIVRGAIPLLSEAKIHNFLDFWKGRFFPVVDAEIYPLTDCAVQLPSKSRLAYINRRSIQSYVPA